MSFPLSPTNGQTAVLNGITYSYSSANALWTRVTGAVPNTIKSTSSANSPANPNIGDIWYNTTTDATYRYTSDGVTSYWLDITGASTTLTTGAASALVVSQPTYAVAFNGTSQYLNVANNAALNFGASSFTVEAWVYFGSSVTSQQCIITTYGGATTGWYLQVITSKLQVGVQGDTTSYTSTTTLVARQWYHFAMSGVSGSIKVFVNGVLDGTYTGTVVDSSATLQIGRIATVAYLEGSISNVRVVKGTALYTAAFTVPTAPLTATTNTSLLTCQTIPVVDASTNAFAVTNVGGASLAIYAAPTVSYASSTVAAASTGTTSTFVILNTTSSTSTTTGALQVTGGVGIGGAVYIQQPSYIAGAQIITTATISTILTYRLTSSLGGANVNTAQSVFGVGVTLAGSTIYQFQLVIGISRTVGGNSHTIGFGFGGTASLNNINYAFTTNEVTGQFPTLAAVQNSSMVLTAANTTISAVTSVASKSYSILINGTVSVNSGGTFIPQYTTSVAPGGAYTTAVGSYITLTPINSITGTWA